MLLSLGFHYLEIDFVLSLLFFYYGMLYSSRSFDDCQADIASCVYILYFFFT